MEDWDLSLADDIAEAFDDAVEAAKVVFRTTLRHRLSQRAGNSDGAALGRYRQGSWKRDVLEVALKLRAQTGRDDFRFSDLSAFSDELAARHPEQKALMSGVSVTLRSLVRDGVLRQPERGRYALTDLVTKTAAERQHRR